MFVYIRSDAFVIVVTKKLVLQQPKTSQQSVRKPYRPLLLFNISSHKQRKCLIVDFRFFVAKRSVHLQDNRLFAAKRSVHLLDNRLFVAKGYVHLQHNRLFAAKGSVLTA